MVEDKILIDRETLKAIAVDSRLNILKLLSEKDYTLTDLADLLDLKKSTVKEHLDKLESAKLIKKEDTKRKWKYFSLTFKGKMVVKPREVKVMFMFIINVFALLVAVPLFLKKLFVEGTASFAVSSDSLVRDTSEVMVESAPMVKTAMVETAATIPSSACTGGFYSISGPEILIGGAILLVLVVSASFMLGYLIKKRNVLINNK